MKSPDVSAVLPGAGSATAREGASSVAFVFERELSQLGWFRLRALRIPEDIPIVHAWVSQEYARYWGLTGQSVELVAAAYVEIARSAEVYLGFHRDEPTFLVECYRPSHHTVGEHYPVADGDRGMHVLVAPAELPVPGFTWSVFSVVMDFLFSDPTTSRVVVEPDIRNAGIHALNRRAGFRYAKVIELPSKTAHLAFCTRERYRAAQGQGFASGAAKTSEAESQIAHLQPEIWRSVNGALIRKAIAELSHERLLQPRRVGHEAAWCDYMLTCDKPEIEYRFRARLLQLDHWDIDLNSLEKTVSGERVQLDALDFIIEMRERLGIDAAMLPVYLEEIASTLYAAAYKHARQELSAADLVHAEFQEIETAMTEGHPAFVANSGRVGFDASDYLAYAPETGAPIQLVWLAAHRRNTEITTAADLTYEQLIREELGEGTVEAFNRELERQGLDPRAYLFMPAHPWQWFNKLATVFAADIAERDLVCLGYGSDTYRAQQSIRTFFNLSHPHKRYVKTALSVLNMGFMRGLSADYMSNTPPINDWINELIRGDSYFAEHGFGILREVAGIGYRNPRFEGAVPKQSPYRKMLAALWRESPVPQVKAGQRLMTMAALLHRDRDGIALLPQLIQASGVGIDTWLDRYLSCYLAPLVHCFYRYDLAFMPHGENVILLLEGNVPARAFMKDIAEEAVIMDVSRVVPQRVQRLCVSVPEDLKALSIFTDVFDGILRYLAQILLEQAEYPEERFWGRVADCLLSYRRTHPDCSEKMERHDLFAPEFRHSCLNRLQLRNNQQMVDLADPASDLQFAGTLKNPIAMFRHAAPERGPFPHEQQESGAI
jgi:siderophore synthetase component